MKIEAKATAGVILDRSRPGKDGTSPVKLRVIYDRKFKDWVIKYPVPNEKNSKTLNRLAEIFKDKAGATIKLNSVDFDRTKGEAPRGNFKELKSLFTTYEEQARNCISDIGVFTYEKFEQAYFNLSKKTDVSSHFEAISNQLRAEGRISTAVSYECALRSLKAFHGESLLTFEMIDVNFLKRYEAWMKLPRVTGNRKKAKANSITSVGFYLRALRAVWNVAKPAGVPYPFGEKKRGLFQIPTGANVKKALKQSDVGNIAAYKPIGYYETRSRDLWLFSYLANGINMKDISRLKYSNIVEGEEGLKITFSRAKTATTRKNQRFIEIPITRQIGRIIDRWGNKPAEQNQYIFPILHNGMTPEAEYKAVQQVTATTNKHMKEICAELELPPVTTYHARHSFATVLKRAGVSTEFISESLGHTDLRTTENYLANFEDKKKREIAEMLLPEIETNEP